MTLSTQKQLILLSLLDIRDNGPKTTDVGICYNVLDQLVFTQNTFDITECKIEEFFYDNFPLWEKYTGDISYPVPFIDDVEVSPKSAFYGIANLWEGSYGTLRYELLDFLIAQLVEEQKSSKEF